MQFLDAAAGAVVRAGEPVRAAAVVCTHCGLAVPSGLVARRTGGDEPADGPQFCCHGCETAYAVIHRCGLDRYYALRAQSDPAGVPSVFTGRSYAEFDDATFHALYVRTDAAGMRSADLFLAGVHCAACVWLVERLPRLLPGVIEARADLGRAMIHLSWDGSRIPLSQIARTLDSIGYPPTPARDARSRARRREEDHRQLARLAVAGACAGNVMLFAFSLYAGLFSAMEPAHRELFRWMSMLVTLVSLAWPGRVFFTSAWAACRTRTPHFDVPIALALGAGGVWSVWSTVTGTGEVYFDTVSVLVFALLVGRFLQARQQRSAADSVELLFSLTPASARRVKSSADVGGVSGATGEAVEDVPVEALRVGDTVEVRPGECLPADGEVCSGRSAVDQAVLTGESRPVEVGPGDGVAAGTVNVGSVLRLTVGATGESTRVARLMRLVEDGARRRAPIVRFADRVAGHFTIGMLALAGVTLAVWLVLDAPRAIDHAVALLVVTCPCALGLATPLVMTIAMGRAARRRTLIKGGDCLQRLAASHDIKRAGGGVGTIYLDKTGTITVGGMSLVDWVGDDDAKPAVAAIEAQSNHPIAAALARDLRSGDLRAVTDLAHTTGGGFVATVDGHRYAIGSPAFVAEHARAYGGGPIDLISRALDDFASRGLTPVAVARDGRLVAAAALGDVIRPDSAAAIARLRALGWRVGVLSGDHPAVVRRIAASVGIAAEDARGGLSPEAKLDAVRAMGAGRDEGRDAGPNAGPNRGVVQAGPTVMVGDGVNDAAALAAADVGVAVHGGVEASLAAADVYLGAPGLSGLVELIEGSRRTMRVIRRNLFVSLFYNCTAGTLAVLGLVSPLVAAVVMPISSLTAVALSLRSRTFGDRP